MTERDGGDHTVISQEAMETVVEVYGRTGDMTAAARAVGVSTTTIHKWKNRSALKKDEKFHMDDPLSDEPAVWFHEALAASRRAALGNVEGFLFTAATVGHPEPVIHKGQLSYERDYEAEPKPLMRDGKVVCDSDGDPILIYPIKKDADGMPVVLTVNKRDNRAAETLMKNLDPDWREKSEVDLTSGGKPILLPMKPATEKEWEDEWTGVKPGENPK